MCPVPNDSSEPCGTSVPGLALPGFAYARSDAHLQRPPMDSQRKIRRESSKERPLRRAGERVPRSTLFVQAKHVSKYSPHLLWIRLWIPYDFWERLRLRQVDLSFCLFVGHPHQMEVTTTNCGSGRTRGEFHAFLDVEMDDARLFLCETSEYNHS